MPIDVATVIGNYLPLQNRGQELIIFILKSVADQIIFIFQYDSLFYQSSQNEVIVNNFILGFQLLINKSIQQIYYYQPTPKSHMRPLSQRQNSNSAQKPDLQIKLKSRIGAHSRLQDLNVSGDSHHFIQTQRSRHNQNQFLIHEDQFAKTASKLVSNNFDHHDQQSCVCSDCHCGRHLCKLNVIRPDLTKKTIYQRSFYEQKHIPNIVNHDKQYSKLMGPHLDMNSTYLEGFRGKSGDNIERPVPEDLLKSYGPSPQLSTYSSHFPGYKGDNQYIKPTDRHIREYFPLRSKSTYDKEYRQKDPLKDDYTYFPDQLRSKSNWFGKTTYQNFFNNPNPEYFAKKIKILQKLHEKPDYAHQYETVYKNDFIPKENPLCPSKVHLQTKAQGRFIERKGKFAQNADFKALNPEFHAISTSKHSYV